MAEITPRWLLTCARWCLHAILRRHTVILDIHGYPYCTDCRIFARD